MYKCYMTFKVLLVGILFISVIQICAAADYNDKNGNMSDSLQNSNETTSTPKNKTAVSSKDNRDEDILRIPAQRPYTPVYPDSPRSLYPVRIIVGESLCIYEKYTYFYDEIVSRRMEAFDLLLNATITINENDFYFYDPEDLCVSVDDELNVDIWQFDCNPAGYCDCGIYFGYVDTDIPPRIEDGQVRYTQVSGLDRKLVVEDGECKSGLKGHCSLLDGKVPVKNPLLCSNIYECISDDSYISTLTNKITNQTYGVCLHREYEILQQPRHSHVEDTGDNVNSAATPINFLSFYQLSTKNFWHCYTHTIFLFLYLHFSCN